MEHKNEAMTSSKLNKPQICTELAEVDVASVWKGIRHAAIETAAKEPYLRPLLDDVVISRNCLAESLATRLARRLARADMQRSELELLLSDLLLKNPKIVTMAASDMIAIVDRDAACSSFLEPLLFYKGFLAISTYRISFAMESGS